MTTPRITSLTIDNILTTDVGDVLETLREAGFVVEVNISCVLSETKEEG